MTLGLASDTGRLLFVRREGIKGKGGVDGGHVRTIDLNFTQSPPDSDPGYYDFDIGSPLSPDETCPNQPSLINTNDDLAGDQVPDDDDNETVENERTSSDGGESGYAFATPEIDVGMQELNLNHNNNLTLSFSSETASDETSESSTSHYFDASEFWIHSLKFTKSNVYDAYNAPTEEKV